MNVQTVLDDNILVDFPVNRRLNEGFNNTMGFLNDIQSQFPKAISFVAGRPDEACFNIDELRQGFDGYVDHMAAKTGKSRKEVVNGIGQYNNSKGIINDIIADFLRNDENIHVAPGDTIITVGAQEAFSIVVSALCNRETDVILTEDPSYIGLSAFAKIYGYPLRGVKVYSEGMDLDALKEEIERCRAMRLSVKLVYVIPDHQNPSGTCMSVEARLKLLQMADDYNFLIVEDGVYNNFNYVHEKKPTLKSLDTNRRVIYIGSFAKLLFPGLRIGVIVADQKVMDKKGRISGLIDEMEKVKGQLTNNTPSIDQAMLGGLLIRNNKSLKALTLSKVDHYREKRNAMLESLHLRIGRYRDRWARDIHWNEPGGGFFIRMSLPFTVANDDVSFCAENYGVIFCPMKDFYLDGGGTRELRLSFSSQPVERIIDGVACLSEYLRYRVLTGE